MTNDLNDKKSFNMSYVVWLKLKMFKRHASVMQENVVWTVVQVAVKICYLGNIYKMQLVKMFI